MLPISIRALSGLIVGASVGCAAPRAERPADSLESPPKASPVLPRRSPRSEARATARLPRQSYPWLGVEVGEPRAQGIGLPVIRILRGSPAARAGLERDDVIMSVGGERLIAASSLGGIVRGSPSAAVLSLDVERRGARGVIEVPLEGAPASEDIARLELVGFSAPEISGVVTFQGSASSLRDLVGTVVLLEFWASYCAGCRALAPRLERLHVEYSGRGLTVVGLTVDPLKVGAEVARKLHMTYSLASDPDAAISNQYLAREIPMLVLIDRRGYVRDVTVGPGAPRMAELETEIGALLAETP